MSLDTATLARLNTNGQAISVSKALMPRGARLDAAPLKSAFAARQGSNKVAMTFLGGTHDLWLRYWLAAGGIDPDREVETIVVPPPQMVANMKVGTSRGVERFFDGKQFDPAAPADHLASLAIKKPVA